MLVLAGEDEGEAIKAHPHLDAFGCIGAGGLKLHSVEGELPGAGIICHLTAGDVGAEHIVPVAVIHMGACDIDGIVGKLIGALEPCAVGRSV